MVKLLSYNGDVLKFLKYFHVFFLVYLPFIIFQTISLVLIFGLESSINYYSTTLNYQLFFLVFISVFSIVISKFYLDSVEIHINVIKERSSNKYSCFFRLKVDDLVNLNSFSAFYSLLPFSMLFNPLDPVIYVSIIGDNLKRLAERKKEMLNYLSMAFRDVKELKDKELNNFIVYRSNKNKRIKNDKFIQSFLIHNQNDLNYFLNTLRQQDKWNIISIDMIACFDKSKKKINSLFKDEYGYFRGIEIQIISYKNIESLSNNEENMNNFNRKNAFNYLSFISFKNAPYLPLSEGLKQISLVIRNLRDFTSVISGESNSNSDTITQISQLASKSNKFSNILNNQDLRIESVDNNGSKEFENVNNINNSQSSLYRNKKELISNNVSKEEKNISKNPLESKLQTNKKDINLLGYLSDPITPKAVYQDNVQIKSDNKDKNSADINNSDKNLVKIKEKTLVKKKTHIKHEGKNNEKNKSIQTLNSSENLLDKEYDSFEKVDTPNIRSKPKDKIKKSNLEIYTKSIENNLCKKLCPLFNESNGNKFNYELCNKLLLRSYRIYKDSDNLEALKQAKISGPEVFIEQIFSLFDRDKFKSAVCFLIFLESLNEEIFFGEEEINKIFSLMDRMKNSVENDQDLITSEKIEIKDSSISV